jgi:hypothetical protein
MMMGVLEMKEFLGSAQVGTIELNEQKKVKKMIIERWDGLGFTDGLCW